MNLGPLSHPARNDIAARYSDRAHAHSQPPLEAPPVPDDPGISGICGVQGNAFIGSRLCPSCIPAGGSIFMLGMMTPHPTIFRFLLLSHLSLTTFFGKLPKSIICHRRPPLRRPPSGDSSDDHIDSQSGVEVCPADHVSATAAKRISTRLLQFLTFAAQALVSGSLFIAPDWPQPRSAPGYGLQHTRHTCAPIPPR
jgi:hypothetical protein